MTESKIPNRGDLKLTDKSAKIQAMFDTIAPKYDFLNRLLSMRQDVKWRKKMVSLLPLSKNGMLVDLACGTGDVCFQVGFSRLDYTRIVGLDLSNGMLERARGRSECTDVKSFRNETSVPVELTFEQANAEQLPLSNNVANAVTIAFGLRNVDNRLLGLQEMYRVLAPGGMIFVLEFFKSDSSFVSRAFELYFQKILPVIGGTFSDRAAYRYLPDSVASMPEAEEFTCMLQSVGFQNVSQTKWLAGATRLFSAVKF